MASERSEQIRALVRSLLKEALPEVLAKARISSLGLGASLQAALGSGKPASHAIHLESDADLNDFARQLLLCAENADVKDAILNGNIQFSLSRDPAKHSGAPTQAVETTSLYTIDKGILNERQISQIAKSHKSVALGTNVVVTPLALDRARACGLKIVRTEQ